MIFWYEFQSIPLYSTFQPLNFEKYVYTSTFYGTTLLLIPNQEPHLLFHYFFIFIRVGIKNQEILLVMGSISFSLLEILGHKRRGIIYIQFERKSNSREKETQFCYNCLSSLEFSSLKKLDSFFWLAAMTLDSYLQKFFSNSNVL